MKERMRERANQNQPENYYKELFGQMNLGFVLVEVLFNEKGKPNDVYYIEANEAANRMTGVDLAGKTTRRLGPKYQEVEFEVFGRVAKTGIAETHEIFYNSLGVCYRFHTYKIGQHHERKVAIVYEDVTERRDEEMKREQVEQRIDEIENKLQTINNLFESLLWEADPTAANFTLTAQWTNFTGQNFEQTQNWGWLDAIHPNDQERVKRIFTSALATGESIELEHRLRAASGEYRWIRVQYHPVFAGDGQIKQWFGAAISIHELKSAREALQKSEDKYRRLADQQRQQKG